MAHRPSDRRPDGPDRGQVGFDLRLSQGLHNDSTLEPERQAQGVIVGRADGDDQWEKAVVLTEGVDGLGTGDAMDGLHLVQPIKQRSNLISVDPRLANLAGDFVPQVQLIHYPLGYGSPRLSPC